MTKEQSRHEDCVTGKHVLVTGATGFIGSRVVEDLLRRGTRVTALTRDMKGCRRQLGPDVGIITSARWPTDIQFDAVVNLAGARIAPIPWTARRRKTLRQSRIDLTQSLVRQLRSSPGKQPSVWIQASAVGYYGLHDAAIALTEQSPQGDDFAAHLCSEWEAAAASIAQAGTRLCILRLGLVLGRSGALPGLLLPIRMGMGGPLGKGTQAFPWIHVDDVVALILECIDNPARIGTYNAVAPEAHTQASFGRCAARMLSRPFWLPVPQFSLRLLGEVSQLFLDGQHVVPERLLHEAWTWRYPNLSQALTNIISGHSIVRE